MTIVRSMDADSRSWRSYPYLDPPSLLPQVRMESCLHADFGCWARQSKRWYQFEFVHLIYCGNNVSVVPSQVSGGFSIITEFYLFSHRFHPRWFRKYNFLLSSALDGGTQVMVFIWSFAVGGASGKATPFPNWALVRQFCHVSSLIHSLSPLESGWQSRLLLTFDLNWTR